MIVGDLNGPVIVRLVMGVLEGRGPQPAGTDKRDDPRQRDARSGPFAPAMNPNARPLFSIQVFLPESGEP